VCGGGEEGAALRPGTTMIVGLFWPCIRSLLTLLHTSGGVGKGSAGVGVPWRFGCVRGAP
jgi:hypothetical protein